MLQLTDPITKVPLIGPSYAKKLKRLEMALVRDLLYHYPSRYVDRSKSTHIADLTPGEIFTIKAQIIDFKNIYTRTGKNLQQVLVADESGQIQITWFNQRYLQDTLQIGETFSFSGKPKMYRNKLSMASPEFEKADKSPLHTGRLVAVYPETAGVSSKWLRSRIRLALKNSQIPEHLPQEILNSHDLTPLPQAIKNIHLPPDLDSLQIAKKRLSFDELFFLQLQGAQKRHHWKQQTTRNLLNIDQAAIDTFINDLPFTLTAAQKKTTNDILNDLQQKTPMNRLLEGDVGSGKTVVAAIAAYATYLSGFKTVLMAPTEILAQQHFQSLKQLFKSTPLKLGIHTGSHKSLTRSDITIGTHALLYNIQKNIDVGLIIIDEQHRFGVKQRAVLESLGSNPHRLTMSATPIPRTVALTLYGDLDVSIIDQMPKQRLPVKTWVVPEKKRLDAYNWIQKHLNSGDQVFVVCPLIDPSESEKLSQVKSVTQEYDQIKKHFPQQKVGLLHGKLKSEEKDAIIQDFKIGEYQILVSTPVIEVGIDIPNATTILIEAAERFGLAQLHQLRGRVGRGHKQSYCLLFTSGNKIETSRLKALTKYNSGFKLAKIDLKIRGPGEVFGHSQHGFSNLKMANLSDSTLMFQTKTAALNLIKRDPNLNHHPAIKIKLSQQQTTITNN